MCDNISTKHAALTVFPSNTPEKEKPLQTCKEEPKAIRPRLDSHALNETARYSKSWLVKRAQDVTIAPRFRHVVTTKLDLAKGKEIPSLVCVEPATIPIQGILSARALTRIATGERDSTQLTSPPKQANTDASASNVYVMLANFSQEELTLPKATVLGLAEEVSETLVDQINTESPTRPQGKTRKEALYKKLLGDKLHHLTKNERLLIEPVLQKYAHVFYDEETNDFNSTDVIEHKIVVTDPTPIRRPQYRTPYELRGEMECQVNDMLQKGEIRKSYSPWSAPAILVPKKILDGKPKFRFSVDFSVLNAVTKFELYPLPRLEDSTSSLFGSKCFFVLDCYSGFWQINISEQHKELTGLTVPSGHYEFNRLPFGLNNSLANFHRLMDIVLKDLGGTDCCIYLDDLILFSKMAEEHAEKLERVLERFERANL